MSKTKKVRRPNVHRQRVELADRYFSQHPNATQFERTVTPAECRVLGLAPGTRVAVFKVDVGYAHAYQTPKGLN